MWDAQPLCQDYVIPWAAMMLCFFSFFRSGEITVPAQEAFNAWTHLSSGDVMIDNPENPQAIRVYLRHLKTDQFGRGTEVIMGRTGNLLCPVAVVAAFMRMRGMSLGPVFIFHDGMTLTKAKFVQIIRQALQDLGLLGGQFAGHSF